MIRQFTSGCTLWLRSTLTTFSMSFKRPLVQLPTTTWVTATSPSSATGRTLAGENGQAAIGSSEAKSSGIESATPVSFVSPPKQAIIAPISMPMLQTVIRSSTGSCAMPGPVNSTALSVRPSTPNCRISDNTISLPLTYGRSSPVIYTSIVSGTSRSIVPVAIAAASSVEPTGIAITP